MNKQNVKSLSKGVAIAIATAGLLSGCQSSPTASEAASAKQAQASTDLVHCYGVNTCNGHNDCKTAANACAGQGSCKGQGFVAMLDISKQAAVFVFGPLSKPEVTGEAFGPSNGFIF